MGYDDVLDFTPEEIEIVTKQGSVFNCFFRHPTSENYQAIRDNDEIYYKALGTEYDLYLWTIRDTFQDLQQPLSEKERLSYKLAVDRLLDLNNLLTAQDLDALWGLYYASGDLQFTRRIKTVIDSDLQYAVVRAAAKWSYNSNIQQGLLEDPKWNLSPPANSQPIIKCLD